MCTFFVLHKRYFQPRLGQRNPLQFIKVIHLALRIIYSDRVCESKESRSWTNLVGIPAGGELSRRLHLFLARTSEFLYIGTRKIKLSYLFLERHTGHQIVDTHRDRLTRIEIQGGGRRSRLCTRAYRAANAGTQVKDHSSAA